MTTNDLVFNFVLALSAIGMTVPTAVKFAPAPATADYFEVHGVRVTRAGEVYVDRTIKAPIDMEYRVRVQAKTPQGWRTVCEGRDGPIHYLPDMAIDQPVTLEWWSGGACEAIPQGPARIVTTWAPRTLDPVTVISEVEG